MRVKEMNKSNTAYRRLNDSMIATYLFIILLQLSSNIRAKVVSVVIIKLN
jgi:hypothetical protein